MNASTGSGCAIVCGVAWSVALAVVAAVLRSPDAAVPIGFIWVVGLAAISIAMRAQMTPAARRQIDASRATDRGHQQWSGIAIAAWMLLGLLAVGMAAGIIK